ncbi:hypothetical protein V6N13_032668 [Hibiscus sabdariffa]|uniref:Glutaredoxin n=1 Tax=Hibiscus sabdariffa TaxID=183260 RepID=A0ABR2FCG6_9ROSI
MQEAIPYKSYTSATVSRLSSFRNVTEGVNGDGGVVISGTGKEIVTRARVNPTVCEVEKEKEAGVRNELSRINSDGREGSIKQLPVIFVGGKLFGGLDKVISIHISGELVPILRGVGAL